MRIHSSDKVLASYAAFCRKFGDYKTHAAGRHCWNEEIIEGMKMDLAGPWTQFRTLAKDFFKRRSNAVGLSFEQALEPLRAIDRNIEALPPIVPH
jgi:hypothetical protein